MHFPPFCILVYQPIIMVTRGAAAAMFPYEYGGRRGRDRAPYKRLVGSSIEKDSLVTFWLAHLDVSNCADESSRVGYKRVSAGVILAYRRRPDLKIGLGAGRKYCEIGRAHV